MSKNLRGDWRVRGASSDDVGAIVALINAHARRHYGEDRIGEEEARTWFSAPGVQQDDTRSWWRLDGALAAYAQVYWPGFPSAWDVLHDVTVHPDHAGDDGLWADIFAWCEQYQWKAAKRPAGPAGSLCCGARVLETDADKRRQYESRGFRHVRDETLMRVELAEAMKRDVRMPDGVRIRELDLARDLRDYAFAHGEAFRDHWGHADSPPDERMRRTKAEFETWGGMYVPRLWFVALEDDTIVGSVGGFLNYGNVNGRCYMYHVFVRREWRNRRIASALLRAEFQGLQRLGGRTVELHIDSDNMTHGLDLYRGFGMQPVWHQRLYEKTVPAVPARS
jgi:ribosomal protein S18 acetylase RimI-like enzyme